MVTFRGAQPQSRLAPAIRAAPDRAHFRPAEPGSGSRAAAARRPPAAGRRASQSAAARGSMPAGAPPPLGRMAQAGRPAGAHILRAGARGSRPPPGGDPARAAARAAGPGRARFGRCGRGERVGGAAASPSGAARKEARRRRRARCGSVASSRSPAPRGRRGPAGVGGGAADERGSPPHAAGSGGSARAPRPAGAAQVGRELRLGARSADGRGAGGARGAGAEERRAWGRAAAARRGGGARGSRGPAARAHRARRRAARAARPPSSARLASPRARPRLPERVPTPPARPRSRHPLPRPSNWSRSPRAGPRPPCATPPRGGPSAERAARRAEPWSPLHRRVPVPTLGRAGERPWAPIGPLGAARWCCHGNRMACEAVRGSDPVTGASSGPGEPLGGGGVPEGAVGAGGCIRAAGKVSSRWSRAGVCGRVRVRFWGPFPARSLAPSTFGPGPAGSWVRKFQ